VSSLPLFDRYAVDDVCAKRHGGSPTSEDAHDSIREHKEAQRQRILRCLEARGPRGGTCEEVARQIGMRYTTVSGRLSELKNHKDGRAKDSGYRRPTTSGHGAAVVVLARYAALVLAEASR
jgi:hypothetical protein